MSVCYWQQVSVHEITSANICKPTKLHRSGFDPRQEQRIFPIASVSRPALGPTQPPVQWVPGVLSAGVKRGRGVTLTTHPHLVPRSWMSRRYASSPPQAPPWRVEGLLYAFTYIILHCAMSLANSAIRLFSYLNASINSLIENDNLFHIFFSQLDCRFIKLVPSTLIQQWCFRLSTMTSDFFCQWVYSSLLRFCNLIP
jgi:hypothetical protein